MSAVLTFIGHAEDGSAGGQTITYTTSAFSGLVVVGITARTNTSNAIASVIIGGVTASPVSGAGVLSADTTSRSDIYRASSVPGGSTQVIVDWGGVTDRSSCAVYTLAGANSVASTSANAVDAGTNTMNDTYTVPTNGTAMNVATYRGGGGSAIVWTNSTSDYNVDVSSVNGTSRASSATNSTTGSVTITAVGAGFSSAALSSAAWGPSASGDTFGNSMGLVQMKRKSLGWTIPLGDHRRRILRPSRLLYSSLEEASISYFPRISKKLAHPMLAPTSNKYITRPCELVDTSRGTARNEE